MLLQNLQKIEAIDYLIITCLLAVFISSVVATLLFTIKLKGKIPKMRNYLLGIICFLGFYAANRVMIFFYELTFDPFVWRLEVDAINALLLSDPDLLLRYDVIWRISTILSQVGLLVFLVEFELQILDKKTKFVFSILLAITATFSVIRGSGISAGGEVDFWRLFFYLGTLPAIAVPLCYFYLAIKATGTARKRAIGAGIGFLILFIGITFNSAGGKSLFTSIVGNISGLQLSYVLYGVLAPIGIVIYLLSIRV